MATQSHRQAGRSDRAGVYVSQPGGYSAFIPRPLPPDPAIGYDDEMLALLSGADRALARLDGATSVLPNPDLFVFMFARKEAVLSSQIEGTQATLSDVVLFESGVRTDVMEDVQEPLNYVAAMNQGLARLAQLPVSGRLICEIHRTLLSEVRGEEKRPGEFRISQNWIGPPGAGPTRAIFVPPPPDVMRQAISDLEKFLHDDKPIPILIKVGLAHAQFETIHPFLDGNGRVGRLLITFLLCEKKILQRPLLYLSHFFKGHVDEYYQRLQATRDQGDWENWLKFFLRGVFNVAQEATATAQRIVQLREQHRQMIISNLGRGAASGLRLLEHLFTEPVFAINKAAQHMEMQFAGARKLISRLEQLKILKQLPGKSREMRFIYDEYLKLFRDDVPFR